MLALVTGANGMLGQDLCPILEDEGYDVIETDIDTLDITNKVSVNDYIMSLKPDIVFHCAGYTDVEKAEIENEKVRLVNSIGTQNIAEACSKINSTLVYISTDYVFDGEKTSPYTPNDKPNPINFYGLTKLMGENAVQKYCNKHYIVRTSWLYGIHGNNFVEKMISLNSDTPIKVVNDQIGCPTWTVDLVNGIIKILNEPFGIYHICGSGSTSWYEFAKEIGVNVLPCKSCDFKQIAKRPQYSVMDNNKICRNWKSALKDYMFLRTNFK